MNSSGSAAFSASFFVAYAGGTIFDASPHSGIANQTSIAGHLHQVSPA
jgi:hypothetical protein